MDRVVRVYSDAGGDSHVEVLELSPPASDPRRFRPRIAVEGQVEIRPYPDRVVPEGWFTVDWHRAARKTFVVALSGEIEVEVSDGTRQPIGKGDLVFLEDTTGKGHITRLKGGVTNMFIPVADTFDVVDWARGNSPA